VLPVLLGLLPGAHSLGHRQKQAREDQGGQPSS